MNNSIKRFGSLLGIFGLLVSVVATAIPAAPAHAASTNLIANPSVETTLASGQPANWVANSWGTNNASFVFKASGHTGVHSLYTSMTTRTDGDAKSIPDPVTITPNHSYTYTDFSIASVGTELDAKYTDAAGNVTYNYLTAVAPSTTWQSNTVTFTTPASAVKVSVVHILASVGSLQTDDFSLVDAAPPLPPPAPDPTGNLVPNASFENQTVPGTPDFWTNSSWGTNTAQFATINTDGHTGTSSSKLTVSNYTSGDAKWFFKPVTTLTAGQAYSFSAWYKTNAVPSVVGAYTDAAGVTHYFNMPATVPPAAASTTWQQYKAKFTLPTGATSFTVYMLLAGNGWLQTDDLNIVPYVPTPFTRGLVTLTFDDNWQSIYTNGLPLLKKYGFVSTQYIISGAIGDTANGYMTSTQLKAFQTQGSELAAHTVDHADLTTLTAAQIDQELSQSKTAIQKLFGTNTALNFATPYGAYNATVLASAKKYYRSQRSTDVGYNSKDNFDPYNIVVQNIEITTTPAQVNAWVDQAIRDKTWLVIVYHQVDTSGDQYSVTPKNLDSEMSYMKTKAVTVKTINQALDEIQPQL